MLVAGGWIRVAERPLAAENELWILGEGGGLALPSTASTAGNPRLALTSLGTEYQALRRWPWKLSKATP